MNIGRSALTIFAWVCLLVFTERMGQQAFGAQKTTKERASPAVAIKAVKPSSEQTQKPASKIVSSTGSQQSSKTGEKAHRQELPTAVKPMAPKGGLHVKIQKKVMPKAVVQPRTDLMYYGVLEDSQRYDARPNPRQGGVQNPQNSDLAHDHFQELDRNQDGKIDPVERAFRRIDMDRDLHTRTLR